MNYRLHGITSITGERVTVIKGYYHGNYFELEEIFSYGQFDYNLLTYTETFKDVDVNDELIDFVNDKKVNERYMICK